ncbi:MAG: glyoxylate/hydroxypyruvate reductase A [Betaproteobacteria bacterium]|nr:glyoxylate/hydroxypyruvate reductase A [Betaproteobacteria bacterium]
MRVIVCLPADDAVPWLDLFAAALPDARVERREPDAPVAAGAPRADYVVAACPCRTVFAEQPAPKAVFTVSAGVAHALRLPNLPAGVPLIRVEDAGMAPQMVRYALAAVLRAALRLDAYAAQQRAARWEQHAPRAPASLAVGVLGLGVIGGEIARALAAQGFAVRGHARTRKAVAGVRCCAGDAELAAFLGGLAVLVSVVPHTPETTGLLDRAALSRLADGAHVVNMGRGSVLVEDDLIALLDSGKLSGATLDVFRAEPLPPEHPFWRRPEIAVTPHVAGLTIPEDTVAQIAAKIGRLERNLPVTGVVDRERGY